MGTKGYLPGFVLFFFVVAVGSPQFALSADRSPLRTTPPAIAPTLQRGISPATAPQVTVATPKAGETIAMSGAVITSGSSGVFALGP